jgi:predicted ATPase
LPVLWHLAVFHLVRGELQAARALVEQCLRLAEGAEGSPLLPDAHALLGSVLTYLPENALALEHCEWVTARYGPGQPPPTTVLSGHNALVISLCYAAWALWVLGHPDRAWGPARAALTLARELGQPISLALALFFAALLHWLRREGPPTRELTEELHALASEHGMAVYQAVATIWRGWALGEAGHQAEGIAQIRQGSAAMRATGGELYSTVSPALLAESLAQQGRVAEGLDALAEALAVVRAGGVGLWEAELHRLRGELLLRCGDAGPPVQAEAEGELRLALEVARRQQAKSLELRAAMSLSRLYRLQGRPAEARPLLAEAYGWFTEGLDTPDLREAKALLEALPG